MGNDALQDKRTKALGDLTFFQTKLKIRVKKAHVRIREIAGCYENAFNRQKTLIKAGEAYEQQMAALGFVILGAVTAGSLSALSTVAQNYAKTAKDLVKWQRMVLQVEGLEDAVQSGVGNLINMAPGKINFSRHGATPPTPTSYQRVSLNVIDKQHIKVMEYLNSVRQKINNAKLNQFTNFDSAKFTLEIGKLTNQFRSFPEFDTNAMEKEIEIGLWANWLPSGVKHWVPPQQMPCTGIRPGHYNYDSLPKPVYQHLQQLLPASSGVKMGWWQSTSELKKVESWAANWKPSQTFPAFNSESTGAAAIGAGGIGAAATLKKTQ